MKDEIDGVACDYCNRSIIPTYGIDMAYLTLSESHIRNPSMACIDILFSSLLERDHHFCGLGCLKKWLEEKK